MSGDSNYPVTLVIDATDRATAKIRAINERFSVISQPFTKLNESFQALGESSGLNRFGTAIVELGQKTGGLIDKAERFALKFGAVATAAAYATFEVVSGFARQARAIEEGALALGISSRAYQENAGVAKLNGIENEAFLNSSLKISKSMASAATGAGEAYNAFYALKIRVTDAHNRLKSFDEILPQLSERLSHMTASARNLFANVIAGKGYKEILPLLTLGAEGFAKQRKEVEALGGVLSDVALRDANGLFSAINRVGLAFEGLKNSVLAVFAPVITGLIQDFTNYLVENHDEIVKWANDFKKSLPENIKQLKDVFSNLIIVLSPLPAILKAVANNLGLVNAAVLGLSIVLGGSLLVKAAETAASIWSLGKAFLGLSAVKSVFLVFDSLATGLGAGYTAAEALVATFYAFPLATVGLIGAAVAAIAGAGYLIYKNWTPLKQFFKDLWGGVQDELKAINTYLEDLIFRATSVLPSFLRGGGTPAPAGSPGASYGLAPGAPLGAERFSSFLSSETNQTTRRESTVRVMFDNLPTGTRVHTEKGDAGVDVYTGLRGKAP